MTRPPRILILAALVVVVGTCKRPDEPVDLSKAIVGTWENIISKATFTFNSNGTMAVQWGENDERGNYEFVEKDKIRMTPDGREGGLAAVKIDKDLLTLIINSRKPEEPLVLKRVK